MGATYNGVFLGHTLTESHDTGPELDPSGTDTLFFKTSVRLQAVLSPLDYPAAYAGEPPASIADRITHLLCSPRKSFSYTVGTYTMLAVPGGDDANGPQPDPAAFSIKHVAEGSFVVTWAVTVRLRRCNGADARGFLSLKWTDAASYAADWTGVRRRAGLLVVSRQFGSPDDLRGVITPAVPAGYRRETADYEQSEDCLRLRFLFVDRQLHKPLPYPAVKVAGSQVETVPLSGGMRRGELSLKLNGPPGGDPAELIGVAVRLGMARVYASNPSAVTISGRKSILIGGGIRESLNDSETAVELSLQWQISPPAQRTGGAAGKLRGVAQGAIIGGSLFGGLGALVGGYVGGSRAGNTTAEGRPRAAVPSTPSWVGTPFPGADPSVGVAPPSRGVDQAATLKLMAAALMDPCGSAASLQPYPGDDNYLVGTDPATGGNTSLRAGPADDPTDATVYADDPTPGIWEHWTMTFSYPGESGYDVLPSTKAGDPGRKVRWGNPTKGLRVEWELKRTGDKPDIPRPEVPRPQAQGGGADPNWVLIRNTTTYVSPDVTADGVTFTYEAAGVAEHKAIDPAKVVELYPAPPFLDPSKLPAGVAPLTGKPTTTQLGGGPPVGA